MIEHHIEKQIIERLIYAGQASFSELKPAELMNNAFDYHLKVLLRRQLIEKSGEGYRLTAAGQAYADKLSFSQHRLRVQPKLIAILALQNSTGQWLLAERKVEPYLGQLMLPSGKQHFGESPDQHVVREVSEQLGAAVEMQRSGMADIRIARDGQTLTHIVAQVYRGIYDGPAPEESTKFRYRWADLPTDNLLAGTYEIMSALGRGDTNFFISLDAIDG